MHLINWLKKSVLYIFLFVCNSIFAQDISLFSGVYYINNNSSKIYEIENQDKKYENTNVNFGLGSYIDFDNWSLYSEIIFSHHHTSQQNISDENIIFEEYINPNYTSITAKLGGGKLIPITKVLKCRLYSYLGYGFTKARLGRIRNVYSNNNYSLTYQYRQTMPRTQSLQLGIRTSVEYKLAKRVALGIGLEAKLLSEFSKGKNVYTTRKYQDPSNYEIVYVEEEEIDYYNLQMNYLNYTIFLSYRLTKK